MAGAEFTLPPALTATFRWNPKSMEIRKYRFNLKDLKLPAAKLDREIALREQAAILIEQLLGVQDPDEELTQAAMRMLESMHQVGRVYQRSRKAGGH